MGLSRRRLLNQPNPLIAHGLHQPNHRAAGDIKALASQLPPDFAHAVDLPICIKGALDVRPKLRILYGTIVSTQ